MRALLCAAIVIAACSKSDKKQPPSAASEASSSGQSWIARKTQPPKEAGKTGHECGTQLAQVDVKAPPQTTAQKIDPTTITKAGLPTQDVQGFAGVKQTGFRVSYSDSTDATHEQFHQILQSNKMFEAAAQELNQTIRLPTTVDIQLVDCDQVNAFYDPDAHRIIVCYDLLAYFVQVFKPVAKSDDELGTAVLGATLFAFYHETGHGLIHLLDLPTTGREEDDADQIATLILMSEGDDGVAMALSGAYWFQLQQQSGDDTPFWDEHGFGGQRFYNILCLIYGSDPQKYADFVSSGNLPEDRAQQCPTEYAKVKHAWERLLQPYLTNESAKEIDVAPPVPVDTPAHAITCEQVADKAIALIVAPLDPSQKEAIEPNLPSFREQFLAQCAKEDWPDKDRQCVMDATSVDDASRCGQ